MIGLQTTLVAKPTSGPRLEQSVLLCEKQKMMMMIIRHNKEAWKKNEEHKCPTELLGAIHREISNDTDIIRFVFNCVLAFLLWGPPLITRCFSEG